MISLVPIDYTSADDVWLLYRLLAERKPEQSISHKGMPDWDAHCRFVSSQPYLAWYLVVHRTTAVGAVYLSKEREIGIAILRAHQRRGYGRAAVEAVMAKHPGPIFANVNPDNEPSRLLWESLGYDVKQVTYGYAE